MQALWKLSQCSHLRDYVGNVKSKQSALKQAYMILIGASMNSSFKPHRIKHI